MLENTLSALFYFYCLLPRKQRGPRGATGKEAPGSSSHKQSHAEINRHEHFGMSRLAGMASRSADPRLGQCVGDTLVEQLNLDFEYQRYGRLSPRTVWEWEEYKYPTTQFKWQPTGNAGYIKMPLAKADGTGQDPAKAK